jgi:hypothetical protein
MILNDLLIFLFLLLPLAGTCLLDRYLRRPL